MAAIILKFPEPSDFFDWLKKKSIHEYGSVVIENRRADTHGVPYVIYSVRMTAYDDSKNQIIQCELPFYNGVWINRETCRKQAEKGEADMKAYIKKVHEETFKDYDISVIPAEFMTGEEKE